MDKAGALEADSSGGSSCAGEGRIFGRLTLVGAPIDLRPSLIDSSSRNNIADRDNELARAAGRLIGFRRSLLRLFEEMSPARAAHTCLALGPMLAVALLRLAPRANES